MEQTQLGQYLSDAMARAGLSIKELAERCDVSYEYIRRLVRGEGLPSKHMLRVIAAEVGADRKEVERLLVADSIRRDYGKVPLEISGKNPDAELFERHISELTPDQREALEAMLMMFVKQNRAGAQIAVKSQPRIAAKPRIALRSEVLK
jgi:transcriptional regulator with XRE-family HTH domain